MFDHLLESSRREDSNKWSNIGFGQVITQVETIEVHFTHLIWSSAFPDENLNPAPVGLRVKLRSWWEAEYIVSWGLFTSRPKSIFNDKFHLKIYPIPNLSTFWQFLKLDPDQTAPARRPVWVWSVCLQNLTRYYQYWSKPLLCVPTVKQTNKQ